MKLLTWNIMIPILPPLRFHGQWERLREMPKFLESLDCDVICFNELIPQVAVDYMVEHLKAYPFKTTPLSDTLTVYGGVQIFSKYPMTYQRSVLFAEQCVSSDCFSAKGCVVAGIMLPDKRIIHVVATHLQSGKGEHEIRVNQVAKIKELISSIPMEDVVVFAGDLNEDIKDVGWVANDLQLNVVPVSVGSYPYTFAPDINPLVGLDDPDDYKTEQYPNGCFDELMKTKRCVCCEPQWLDHFFVRGIGGDDVKMYVVRKPLDHDLRIPYTIQDTAMIRYLSDHLPVLLEIQDQHFLTGLTSSASQTSYASGTNSEQSACGIVIILLVCMVVVCVIVFPILFYRQTKALEKMEFLQ